MTALRSHSVYRAAFLEINERHFDRVEYVIDGTMMLAGPSPS
jgi:hypothetical protein